MTPHNEAKKEDIAKVVLMPGDPLRAKYIADNFLENPRLVNSVRNMLAYTGMYKGKEITVFSSGMGMPSMGIYCYELYKFYDVESIIRIGSCGTTSPDIKLFDTILADASFTEGNFALAMNNANCHLVESTRELSDLVADVSKELNIDIVRGTTLCNEYFDPYAVEQEKMFARLPKDLNLIGAEMEAFALYYTAKCLNKQATCLLTVVDSPFDKTQVTADDRQTSLNNMIKLALETTLKL